MKRIFPGNRMSRYACGLAVLFVTLGAAGCKERKTQLIEDKLSPLPAHSIHLNGFLDNDIRNSVENWNKGVVPYEKMVEFFRSGRAQFALGEMWGKAVRSACMFYRYNNDQELRSILDATVQDLLSTQRANGSISCTPEAEQPGGVDGDLWERKYVMLGLEEYLEHVNPDPAVLEALMKHADCIISQIGHAPKVEIVDLGWSATNIGHEECHIESSTLLEPFMRLYNLTGEQRYLDFATYIVESGGTKHFDLIQQAFDNTPPHQMSGHYPKAYEMMSMFEGVVEYYRVTGDERCRQAVMNLYNNIRTQELTIIGNGGGDQPYHPYVFGEGWDNTYYEQTNPDMKRMMETCVGVTWMKLCSQLSRLTGMSSTMDDVETYVYNGLLGAMKPTGDGFSYVNLLNGQKVTNEGWGWEFDGLPVTCCNLNGPMGLAYIPFVAVMNSGRGPVVNLYNAADVAMKTPKNNDLALSIVTDYPQSGNIAIDVDPAEAEQFTLSLRMPAWCDDIAVKVNGEAVEGITPGTYADIDREWQPGDKVEITFAMKCLLIDAPSGSNPAGKDFQAVKWGPIVLSRDQNTDPDYNKPVQVVADADGIVNITKVEPTLPGTRMEFIVPTTDGDIRMIDYASVSGWEGMQVCTWLPKKDVIQVEWL